MSLCLVFSFASSYDAVNAMLLNEFLKEHRKSQEMQNALGALTTKLEEQAAQIQKVGAQLDTQTSPPCRRLASLRPS